MTLKGHIHFFIVLVACFGLSHAQTYAVSPITLVDSVSSYALGNGNYEYFEDQDQQFTIDGVSQEDFDRFILNTKAHRSCENPTSAYWVKFKLKCSSEHKSKYIFDAGTHTQNIQLYLPTATGYKVSTSGRNQVFSKREYDLMRMWFDLPFEQNKELTVYARVSSANHSLFNFHIIEQRSTTSSIAFQYLILGLYYGVLLLLALYNFIMYFIIKNKLYMYYTLYIFSVALLSMAGDGLGFQFIWSDKPWFNPIASQHIGSFFLIITFALYTRTFLSLEKDKKLDRIFWGAMVAYFVYYILIKLNRDLYTILPDFYIIAFATMWGIGVYRLIKGDYHTRFYLFGFTFVFVSILINKLCELEILEWTNFTKYALNYAFMIEAIAISLAMVDRFKIFKRDKEIAQAKVIFELKKNEELKDKLLDENEKSRKLEEKMNEEIDSQVKQKVKDMSQQLIELTSANKQLQNSVEEVNTYLTKQTPPSPKEDE